MIRVSDAIALADREPFPERLCRRLGALLWSMSRCQRCMEPVEIPPSWAPWPEPLINGVTWFRDGAMLSGTWALYCPRCAPSVAVCRECGCTEEAGCACGCIWIAPDLCSACGFYPVEDVPRLYTPGWVRSSKGELR